MGYIHIYIINIYHYNGIYDILSLLISLYKPNCCRGANCVRRCAAPRPSVSTSGAPTAELCRAQVAKPHAVPVTSWTPQDRNETNRFCRSSVRFCQTSDSQSSFLWQISSNLHQSSYLTWNFWLHPTSSDFRPMSKTFQEHSRTIETKNNIRQQPFHNLCNLCIVPTHWALLSSSIQIKISLLQHSHWTRRFGWCKQRTRPVHELLVNASLFLATATAKPKSEIQRTTSWFLPSPSFPAQSNPLWFAGPCRVAYPYVQALRKTRLPWHWSKPEHHTKWTRKP